VTRAARFTQSDLTRAIKAMEKAGVQFAGAKIHPDGSITVLTGPPDAANDKGNPLDRIL
jgi:hypothetical protein